ncbi:MAG: NusG domain II-containing protein [bacterium]|nr:NusG domain II-containing protein [bacterium]
MKSNIKWILTFALLCAVCCALWFLQSGGTDEAVTAQIRQGDTVIKTIDLSAVSAPYEFDITDENGGYNRIRVETGSISVIEADCPDRVCVNQGSIRNSMRPIVCLPHKLSITITGKDNGMDAAAGGM